jgi:hypothetical protein
MLPFSMPTLDRTALDVRLTLAALALIALAGLALGWNKGQLPRREVVAVGCTGEAKCTTAGEEVAPDLALYAAIIADVRGGRDYYDAAHERIPQAGFPISSPLNWRLPTYAWVLSALPNKCWIQGVLLLLGAGGLWLTFVAERSTASVGHAAVATFLMFGVFRWVLDGQAYLAQEVWAGVLLMISTAGLRQGETSPKWRLLAVAAGIAALLFRELALPYCLVAGGMALWRRRWSEAALWGGGVALFTLLVAWHVGEVRSELAEDGVTAGGAGLAQWLRLGGLDFVLLTLRMNSLLFVWPAALLWLYLLASLLGLAHRTDDASRVCCLAALLYLGTFAIVGRPENFYWGLVAAPLLVWGPAHAPAALAQKWRQAATGNLPPVMVSGP